MFMSLHIDVHMDCYVKPTCYMDLYASYMYAYEFVICLMIRMLRIDTRLIISFIDEQP
jgi:hypothetical protein